MSEEEPIDVPVAFSAEEMRKRIKVIPGGKAFPSKRTIPPVDPNQEVDLIRDRFSKAQLKLGMHEQNAPQMAFIHPQEKKKSFAQRARELLIRVRDRIGKELAKSADEYRKYNESRSDQWK